MENLESRLKNAPYFRCEKGTDSIPLCRKCETCVLAWKIFSTKEWFCRINDISQRRFLVGILKQLNSLYLLHYFQNILQTTQGKDFIYNRSRINLSKKEGKVVKSSLNQMLDKTVEQKMKEILYWFANSTQWTKANYTLLLLQMCNPKLLLTAANVIRVLFLREENNISGKQGHRQRLEGPRRPEGKASEIWLNQDITDVCFSPEKDHSSKSATSQVYWTAKTQHTSLPLSKAPENEHLLGAASNPEEPWRNSLRCISEMNRLFSGKGDITKPGYDPCNLLVDLDDIRDLSSGFSKYRDFIRYLPIHLSKYILSMLGCMRGFPRHLPSWPSSGVSGSIFFFPGMLDRHTLNKCASVSQHWAAMAQQVKMDLSAHGFIQNQITFLQGSYTRGIDPNYANKVSIPVPKMVDDGKSMRVKHPKWKLRTKNEYNLWTAYQNEETQQVLIEERNVFCGTYNVRILSDTWDQNRVIHYSGGDLIAVSSNRKIHLLDIIQVKAIPVEFRGHAGSVRALFLCEEENFLLSGSYDLSIRYWDLKSGVCTRIFGGHQGTITCMDLCKNRLVSGGRDCQVKVWDVDTGKCLKTFRHKDPILATRINDTYIVSSCERGLVKVWHIAMAQLVKTLSGHEGAVKCLFFDQWHLLSGSTDGLVMAWSMVGKYERCLMAFKHPKEVLDVSLLFLRVISACADGKIRIYNFLNGNCMKVLKANGRDDVEKAQKQGQLETPGKLPSHPKKKSWKIPMSPDQFLLTVSALQHAHNSGEFAYPCRPQTEITDVWGPSISYPRKVLNFKGKSIQRAVDRLRLSNPPIDVKRTSIPLEIQKLQPNLKISLHSPRVQSTIPQPMIIRSRFSGSLKGGDQVTSSIERAVCSTGPLTSMQVIKPNRMLAPQVGTATLSLKKERPRIYTALDPFRVNTEFVLLTVKEEKEHQEAKMKEYQARESTGVVDPGKVSKAAWIRKIKGLPIDNFTKQGKTAAPELGQNVFI
ncbi:F-box/WD repeat-containing protein 10 isoform X11 [Homo sapiens]|uniref:F-box/WD repeat-containing protein 10 isoform X11 n=1 Tax=Homo sapiens TaxID=9606 RepID=UPI001FB179E0|nr:F-box/WD repeat-containing protein 10 isoform X11 [Homo sapiens]XP_054170692.1 F-box/WD repeat-containing protein 10 isoform X11 [Homo sapiens]